MSSFISVDSAELVKETKGRPLTPLGQEIRSALLESAESGEYKTRPASAVQFALWDGRIRSQARQLGLRVAIRKTQSGDIAFQASYKEGSKPKPATTPAVKRARPRATKATVPTPTFTPPVEKPARRRKAG